ncbi:MAG TPA: GNAT family N-acetyltransferase, partial [Urbifossiella sp.]|nr:GNAT family N-acetyltransferase [Urbifossiella sp.]
MRTTTLDLTPLTRAEALAAVAAMSPAEAAQLSADWLARLHAAATDDPWVTGFAVVHRESGAVVGKCGFKAPPTADGMVEIAYGMDPAHRGKGFATEAAGAL